MKWWKEHAERKRRRERRRKMGRLEDLVIAKKTLERYEVRVDAFFAKRRKRRAPVLRTVAQLDEALEEELGDLWWGGWPKGHAADLLSGVQHLVPRSRKKLVGAWRLYGAWNRLEYPDRAPPMAKELMLAVADGFWRRGCRRSAAVVLLAYHCYVRSGEFLQLRKRSLGIGAEGRGVVSLGVTKGRRVEMVTIDDERVGLMLKGLTTDLKEGDRVMDLDEKEFRKMFKEVMSELGLERFRYKPYSLRRGGATEDFRRHGSLDRSLLRGRWKGVPSARQYILEGVEMSVRLQRTLEEERRVLKAAQGMMKRLGG